MGIFKETPGYEFNVVSAIAWIANKSDEELTFFIEAIQNDETMDKADYKIYLQDIKDGIDSNATAYDPERAVATIDRVASELI
jgi:hypothetical protein